MLHCQLFSFEAVACADASRCAAVVCDAAECRNLRRCSQRLLGLIRRFCAAPHDAAGGERLHGTGGPNKQEASLQQLVTHDVTVTSCTGRAGNTGNTMFSSGSGIKTVSRHFARSDMVHFACCSS